MCSEDRCPQSGRSCPNSPTDRTITGQPLVRSVISWTDAFAVSNFFGLYQETGDEKLKHLALRLVDQVHHVLGRHRRTPAAPVGSVVSMRRTADCTPPWGGLRIGKQLKERGPNEALDEQLEWDPRRPILSLFDEMDACPRSCHTGHRGLHLQQVGNRTGKNGPYEICARPAFGRRNLNQSTGR